MRSLIVNIIRALPKLAWLILRLLAVKLNIARLERYVKRH